MSLDDRLPDLENLIRMDFHSLIGTLEKIEEVTPQEFIRLTLLIPRKEWKWHNKPQDRFEGTFSVPMKYKVENGALVPTRSRQRMYWRVTHYTENGNKWLLLTRQAEPPEQLGLPGMDITAQVAANLGKGGD